MTMQFRVGKQPFEIVRNDGPIRIRTGGPGLRGLQGAPGAGDVIGPSTPVTSGHVAVFDGSDGKHVKSGGFAPANAATLAAHVANDGNPHGVTKSQVGLGNVDNTSDADKPVSTAQAAAMYKAATLAPVANLLVPAEPAAAAFDLLALAGLVRDDEDRAKSWAGDVNDKIPYVSPPSKYVCNRAGVFVPGTTLRCDHDPVTLKPLGARLEGQSTNLVRNPRAEGAVPGTPGTMPPYWSNNPANGIQQEVVGTGVEDGINYLDLRSFGTATANHAIAIYYEQSSAMLVSVGETITNSCFIRRVGGSMANIIGMGLLLWEANAAGSPNGSATSTSIVGMTDAPLRTQRWKHTRTMANEGTARVFSQIRFNVNSGNTIDITLRIGLPQIEKRGFASSPILPPAGTLAQATRAADLLRIPLTDLPFNPAAGTLLLDSMVDDIGGAEVQRLSLESGNENRISIRTVSSASDVYMRSNGVTVWDSGNIPFVVPARRKLAVAWDLSSASFVANGALVQSTAISGPPTGLTHLLLYQLAINHTVRSFGYLPRPMSVAEMQDWTAL